MPIVFGVVLKRFKRSASKADRGVEPAWVQIPLTPKILKIKGELVMVENKELRIMQLENRLNKLKNNPVENVNLMRKVNRQLRKLKGE